MKNTHSRPLLLRSVWVLALTGAAGAATAHHGWSGYDAGKVLHLTGTITHAGYEHPHGFVKLQTQDKLWLAVLAPPNRMENRGLARELLQPGVQATLVGYPNRNDPNEIRAERITINGKTVELR